MDAQHFLRHLVYDLKITPNHVIMNLPASAPELLTVFRGYPITTTATTTTTTTTTITTNPTIHLHCFAPKIKINPQSHTLAIERCEKSLGCKLDKQRDQLSIHIVRDVSPANNMICMSFKLPPAIQQLTPIILESKPTQTTTTTTTTDTTKTNDNEQLSQPPQAKKTRLQ
mmetsp:Transcript_8898/g.8490  ORF Transcript_8898/g.8490 Transcript_8898/m.8490 type:complete len:170 (-) Transcript_8898:75-584(-)